MTTYFSKIIDADTPLKDSGAVTATGAGTVATVAKILDIGAGFVRATALITVASLDVAGSDENYTLTIQGSNSASFASGNVNLAMIQLGAAAVVNGGTVSTVGFYPLPFSNLRAGTLYRYIRVHHTNVGATSSIDYTCYVTKE